MFCTECCHPFIGHKVAAPSFLAKLQLSRQRSQTVEHTVHMWASFYHFVQCNFTSHVYVEFWRFVEYLYTFLSETFFLNHLQSCGSDASYLICSKIEICTFINSYLCFFAVIELKTEDRSKFLDALITLLSWEVFRFSSRCQCCCSRLHVWLINYHQTCTVSPVQELYPCIYQFYVYIVQSFCKCLESYFCF